MSYVSSADLPRVLGPELLERFSISRSRVRTELRRRRWQRLGPGVVLTRPDNPTREDWADTGLLLAGRGAAITGWDAVRARGVGDRRPAHELVIVLSPHAMNRVVGGVRIRRTMRPFCFRRQPLGAALELTPLVSLPRAVADTALECRDLGAVRALLGSAVQRGQCSIADLVAEYELGPRNKSRFLRAALADLGDGARSAAEAAAARELCRGPIPCFELYVPVLDQHGNVLRIVDVLWRSLRAALEIDSREFHFDETSWQATLRRHNQLTRLGLAITHYPPSAIAANRRAFVTEVASWLRARVREIGVPLPPGRGVIAPPAGVPVPLAVHVNA